MRSLLRLLAAVLALSLVAAACGSDSDTDVDTSTEDDTTEETEAEDAPEDEGDTSEEEGAEDDDAMEDDEDTGDDDGDAMAASGAGLLSLEDECASFDGIEAPEGFTVNLVTDIGKVDDGTFNEFAFEGMQAAVECFGIENQSVIETVSEADYAANIATTLESDPNVVITVGFLLTTDTETAATENPDINFVGVDQFLVEYPDNMVGVLFNEQEGGFMAGALAASLSETGVVGVVGGREDVPPVVKFVNGYSAGAKFVNPDVNVLEIYNESFTDPAKGASDAAQFIGEGADVVFGAGGQTGSGALTAAAEAGVFAIGVDQDEYNTTFGGGSAPGSEFLASSAIKRVDLAVFRNIAAAVDDSFTPGPFVLTAENDGITYAPFHDAAVSDEAAAKVEEVRVGLADGSIDTGVCAIDGLFVGEGSACD